MLSDKLWNNTPEIENISSIKAYLFASLRNRRLNVFRKRKIRDTHNDKLFEAQSFSGTEDIEIDEIIQERLQTALNSLPDKCREIFLFKIIHGKIIKKLLKNWE